VRPCTKRSRSRSERELNDALRMTLRVLAALGGLALVATTLGSAVKTVMLPRAAVSWITRLAFRTTRRLFGIIAPRRSSFAWRDSVLGYYAPVGLLVILWAWLLLVFTGYSLIFIGVSNVAWRDAGRLSGSSLFTLGFASPKGLTSIGLVFSEAAIGLFLLALLITYLPTIYASFSRREVGVNQLEVRAGSPPSGWEMIERFWRLERMQHLAKVWDDWELWFADVEETHTSLPVLVFFRSPLPRHSWVTSAGAVLDAAALTVSTVDVPHDVGADICIRAGYLCLRRISDFFGLLYDPDPHPGGPISVTRSEWETVVAHMEAAGVPIKEDRDRAWRDFSGWRVNYDAPLIGLANITTAPEAPWSSDRAGDRTAGPRMFESLHKVGRT
jgi:hypothetical protein